jgi:hypothetical protein
MSRSDLHSREKMPLRTVVAHKNLAGFARHLQPDVRFLKTRDDLFIKSPKLRAKFGSDDAAMLPLPFHTRKRVPAGANLSLLCSSQDD